MRALKQQLFFFRGYSQALFFLGLIVYVWFFPQNETFEASRADALADGLAVACLAAGEWLRIWATSYAGKQTRSRRIKAEALVAAGPYAFIRNPIYAGNFLIGLGMVLIAEAFALLPVYWVFFALQYRALVAAEETFLSERFGAAYDRYRASVPRWIPGPARCLLLGPKFPLKELGTAWGIAVGLFFFEWIESPPHRAWLSGLWRWLGP